MMLPPPACGFGIELRRAVGDLRLQIKAWGSGFASSLEVQVISSLFFGVSGFGFVGSGWGYRQ